MHSSILYDESLLRFLPSLNLMGYMGPIWTLNIPYQVRIHNSSSARRGGGGLTLMLYIIHDCDWFHLESKSRKSFDIIPTNYVLFKFRFGVLEGAVARQPPLPWVRPCTLPPSFEASNITCFTEPQTNVRGHTWLHFTVTEKFFATPISVLPFHLCKFLTWFSYQGLPAC